MGEAPSSVTEETKQVTKAKYGVMWGEEGNLGSGYPGRHLGQSSGARGQL